MVQFMKETGLEMSEKVSASKNGLMVQSILENGLMIKQIVRGNLYMQMAIFMKGNGLMIKLMEMVLTLMPMEQSIKVNGRRTSSTVTEWSPGPMVPYMRDSTMMERRMDMGS